MSEKDIKNSNSNYLNNIIMLLKTGRYDILKVSIGKEYDDINDTFKYSNIELKNIIMLLIKHAELLDIEYQTAKEQIETLEQVLSDNDIEY